MHEETPAQPRHVLQLLLRGNMPPDAWLLTDGGLRVAGGDVLPNDVRSPNVRRLVVNHTDLVKLVQMVNAMRAEREGG